MRRRAFVATFAGVVLFPTLAACGPNKKEKQVIDQLLSSMKPHALGRHIIDLPQGFRMKEGGNGYGSEVDLIYGLDKDFKTTTLFLLNTNAKLVDFYMTVAKRENELKVHQNDKLHVPMLIEKKKLSDTVFSVLSYESDSLDNSFLIEFFIFVNGALLHAKSEAYDRSEIQEVESRLARVAAGTSRHDDPTHPRKGFLFGPVLIDDNHDQEVGDFYFYNDKLPDIGWSVLIRALTVNPEQTLLQRWDSNISLYKLGGQFGTIRRGKRTIAGMPGEDLLTKYKEHERTALSFNAESRRPRPAFDAPLMTIDFDSGKQLEGGAYPESSWSPDEAAAVWDAVLNSVRLRPGAV